MEAIKGQTAKIITGVVTALVIACIGQLAETVYAVKQLAYVVGTIQAEQSDMRADQVTMRGEMSSMRDVLSTLMRGRP